MDPTKPRSDNNGMQKCIVILLALNALFTGGILLAVGAFILNTAPAVTPALQAVADSKPLFKDLDVNATNHFFKSAGPALAGLSSFFNTSYNTTLLPPSIAGLATGLLSSDYAPVAKSIEALTTNLVNALETLGPFDNAGQGQVYASAATGLSAVATFATKYSTWVAPPGGQTTPPSWLEQLVFGEGALDWLGKQGDTDKLHQLASVCSSVQSQIVDQQLAGVTYAQFAYDQTQGSPTSVGGRFSLGILLPSTGIVSTDLSLGVRLTQDGGRFSVQVRQAQDYWLRQARQRHGDLIGDGRDEQRVQRTQQRVKRTNGAFID